jgi:hypothetical protein
MDLHDCAEVAQRVVLVGGLGDAPSAQVRVDGVRDLFVGVADRLCAELARHALLVELSGGEVAEIVEVEPLFEACSL